jgi:16S rRNA (cytidine1402-2'-O)-methyltransferase
MGSLYVVSTPIGNLDDISSRARTVLDDVDAVVVEDTRRAGQLLQHLGIRAPFVAYHDHNERERTPALVARLEAGEELALISDAGTPLISDPGYRLVRAAHQAGVSVVPIPGPSAVLAALAAAGLPTDEFHFQGFLPSRGSARDESIRTLASRRCTSVVYEAPHRLPALLQALETAAGPEREAVLARELTKRFETLIAGTVAEIHSRVAGERDQRRGEMVLVLAGAGATEDSDEALEPLARELLRELPASRAARVLAAWSGRRRRELYRWLQDLDGQ